MVFCSYLTGEERDLVIEEKANELEYQKLSMLYDITRMQHEIYEKEVELKILKESASYDDYTYFLEEGEVQNQQQQEGIIQKIIQWFKNFFAKIANLFASAKNGIDDNAVAEIDTEAVNDEKIGLISKVVNAAQKIMATINPKNPDGSINVVKSALEVAGLAAAGITGGVFIYNSTGEKKEMKGSEAKAKINIMQGAITSLQNAINYIEKTFNNICPTAVKEFLDKTARSATEFLKTCIDTINSAFNTAKTTVTNVANDIKDKITGKEKDGYKRDENGNIIGAINPGEKDVRGTDVFTQWETAIKNTRDFNHITTSNGIIIAFSKNGGWVKAAMDSKTKQPVEINEKILLDWARTNRKLASDIQNPAIVGEKMAKKNAKLLEKKTASDRKAADQRAKENLGSKQAQNVKVTTANLNEESVNDIVNETIVIESVDDDDIVFIFIPNNNNITTESGEVVLNEELSQFESIFGTVLEEENETDPEVKELQDMFAEL